MKKEPKLTWEELEEGIAEYANDAYANTINNKRYGREYLTFNSGAVAACADILRAIGSDRYNEIEKLVNNLEVMIQ